MKITQQEFTRIMNAIEHIQMHRHNCQKAYQNILHSSVIETILDHDTEPVLWAMLKDKLSPDQIIICEIFANQLGFGRLAHTNLMDTTEKLYNGFLDDERRKKHQAENEKLHQALKPKR